MIVQGLVNRLLGRGRGLAEGRFLNAFPNRVLRRDPLPYRELSRFARMSAGAAPAPVGPAAAAALYSDF